MKKRGDFFPKTYTLPYQLGVFLAVNAVPDAGLVVDGLNCALPKADLLTGNHDLRSTLLSPLGRHRISVTMNGPLPQSDNPERRVASMLKAAADSGDYKVVLVNGLPYMGLTGLDYDGLASAIDKKTPAAAVPALSFDEDWLDGYDRALEAMVSVLPSRRRVRRRNAVAVVGYLYDRDEGDHRANIAGLRRLLRLAGLDPVCFIPSGDSFGSFHKALEASVVVSLPYGRRAAARLAAASGAKLLETFLPVGASATTAWLRDIRSAAGLKGPLPLAVSAEERRALEAVSRSIAALEHRVLLFAGDPYLYSAFSVFADELGMRVGAAFINSRSRRLPRSPAAPLIMFSPPVDEAAAALAGLPEYDRPSLALCDYFAKSEGLSGTAAVVEIGFPSYTHHCLCDEPFLGYAGSAVLAGRLLNAALRRAAEGGA